VLYFSASSIKDFYKCPKSFSYRRTNKEAAILSDHMLLGTVIHNAIEENTEYEPMVKHALAEWDKLGGTYSETRKPPKSIKNLIKGYFEIEDRIKGTSDHMEMTKEHFFRFKYKDDIMLVGKIDLIANGRVYDWKTGARPPTRYDLHDLQFTTYWLAYRELFKTDPEGIHYGWLAGGRTYDVPMKDSLLRNLDLAIDRMAEICYNRDNEVRVLGYGCNSCLYRGICQLELEE